VLLSIPFVPEGRPANGWQVFLLLFAGVVVLWIFVLVAWALVGLVREVSHEELDAAVASASEPSTRRRDDPE
jgi:threonine/homoserine/homoserine lactone efflux protein